MTTKSAASAFGAIVLAATVALSFASPAEAGQTSTLLKAKVSKRIDGRFKQHVEIDVQGEPGDKGNAYLKVKNRTGATQEANLTEHKGDFDGYTTKFFRNDVNITTHVRGSGYEFTVPPGGSTLFRAKAKHDGFSLGVNELRFVVKDVALRKSIANVDMDFNHP
jgi:hypothetical protein